MNNETFKGYLKRSLRFLPDSLYIRLYFRLRLKRRLERHNPICLNDKLQWLKYNYRFPLQTIVSDKYTVRDYVANKIGDRYLIPLLGHWEHFDDIDFEKLPNRFVLKCNHDSGGLVICTDKRSFNKEDAQKKITRCLKNNFYNIGREYQYRNIIPQVICEEFISENDDVPIDYKIYCFNGVPDTILVCLNRFAKGSHRAQYIFFDKEWNFLRYNRGDEFMESPSISKPRNLEEMLEIARVLSQDFIFARIDLYNVNGKIYFGEITLSPNSGFDADLTFETDQLLGNKLKIPYWDLIRK